MALGKSHFVGLHMACNTVISDETMILLHHESPKGYENGDYYIKKVHKGRLTDDVTWLYPRITVKLIFGCIANNIPSIMKILNTAIT